MIEMRIIISTEHGSDDEIKEYADAAARAAIKEVRSRLKKGDRVAYRYSYGLVAPSGYWKGDDYTEQA